MGGIVDSVEPGGIAEDIGLEPGDEIESIDGQPLRDLIDYRFGLAAEEISLLIRKAGGEMLEVEIEKDVDDGLGIEFESPVFDGLRECNNNCMFCFVNQMPPGARDSTLLYDDDYRLSFLDGNFITLTNLNDDDVERILGLRLSPLYVSVHSTNPDVRVKLFRSRHSGRGLEVLWRLVEGGIEIHTQVVMVCGLNDGDVLERTVRDLVDRHPGIASLGIVPVGLTSHREKQPEIEPVSPELARQTIEAVHEWQQGFLNRLGTRFCYAADELYLHAGVPLPPMVEYEDFPQRENGIGICRLLEEELRLAVEEARGDLDDGPHYTAITGHSAGPFLRGVLDSCGLDGRIEVMPVANRHLGETVTVAGLLAGEDVWSAMEERGVSRYLVPSVALNRDDLFIDGLAVGELRERARRIGAEVYVVEDAPDLVRLLEASKDVH